MQIEIKGYVHARIYSWEPNKPEYQFFTSDDASFMNSELTTYVLVTPVTITAEVPDEGPDYRSARVAALEKEETKLRADFQKRVTEIREEVSRLQAIEYTPAQEAA